MCNVMVPPTGTLVFGVNTRTGATVAPETWESKVMDVKAVIAVSEVAAAVMARASTPTVKATSVLDDILKPPNVAARAAPRVSPVRVMVIAAMPVAAPAVVRTMVVLKDVTVAEVAVKPATVLAMEVTDPKK